MKKNQSYSTSKSRFTKNQSSNLTHQTIKGPADINQHYTLVPKKFDEFDEKTYKKLLHDKHYSQIEFYNLLGSNINRLEISKFKQFNQLSPSIICYYLNYLSEYNSYIKQNYFFDFFQYQNTYDAENELSYEFFEQERKYLKNKFVIEGQHQFIITFIQIQSNFWVLLAFSIMDQVIEIYSFKQELSEEQIEFTVDCFIDYVEDKYEFISRKTNLNKENNEQVIQAQTKNLAINTDGGLLCLSKLLIILEIVPNTSFINEQQLVSFVHNIKFNLLDMVDQYLKYTKQYLKDIKNQNQIQPFTQDKKNDKNIGKFPNKTSRNQAIDFYSDFKEEFKDKNQFQQQRIQNQNLQQNQSDINTISQFIRQESPIIQNQYRNTMPQNSSQVYIKLKQIQEFDKNQYQTLSEQNQLQKLLKKKLYAENVKLQSNNVLEQFFYQQSMEEQLLAMFLNYISRQSEYIQQRVFMDILVGDKLMIQETDLKVLDNPYSKYLIRQPLQENLQLQLYLYIKIGDLFWVLLVLDLQKNEIFFFNYKISLDLQQIQNITEHTLDYLEKKYEFIKLDDEPKLVE